MELLRIAALAGLAGCYSPGFEPCQVRCGTGQPDCPDGTECGDGFCRAPGDDTVCGSNASAIAAGWRHTCAVSDGQLFCWGDNRDFQLGRPTPARSGEPLSLSFGAATQSVAAGIRNTCAIDAIGSLWCWGDNSTGQVGYGALGDPQEMPQPVATGAGNIDFSQVALWGNFTLAIQNGTLWGWGEDAYGVLDIAGTETVIPVVVDDSRIWTSVCAGTEHACALAAGDLYCWGEGDGGRLGQGDEMDRTEPTPVMAGTTWSAVTCGGYHTCAITQADGKLWCWGFNDHGQVGSGAGMELAPYQIGGTSVWTAVDAGEFHTCATIEPGNLYCFGEGLSGELGDGLRERHGSPTEVNRPSVQPWTAVSAGYGHTCGILQTSGLYCWGANGDGQVGNGEVVDEREPLRVANPMWADVDVGAQFTCATAAGTGSVPVLCFGNGRRGQLGNANTGYGAIPSPIDTSILDFGDVDTGLDHACAVDGTGKLWCWGGNDSGQLGVDDTDARLSPAQPGVPADCWSQVATGMLHTCALADAGCTDATTGVIECWGSNVEDQLGTGAGPDNVLQPVPIAGGDSDWTAIYAGGGHTCATKATGLWCWGDNRAGEVGNNSLDDTVPTPTLITDSAVLWDDVALSTAFPGHTCAIRDLGSVQCWGDNGDGQCGALGETQVRQPSAGQLGFNSTRPAATEVCAGDRHSCARTTDGRIYCWGHNERGQLGDGTVISSTMPVEVGTGWLHVDCGGEHTCAIATDESLWCWGRNEEGQLGNGKVTPASPVPVVAF